MQTSSKSQHFSTWFSNTFDLVQLQDVLEVKALVLARWRKF